MIAILAACSLLSLAEPADPADLYVEPLAFDIGLPPPCMADTDCFVDSPLCNLETGECVQCLGPEHCDEGWDCAPTGSCRDACAVDADCEGLSGETLCDPETGFCAQCLGHDGCAPEEYCSEQGWCRLDTCVPGETYCSEAILLSCSEDGGTSTVVEVCPEACEATDGTAQCVAGGASTGGTGAGGGDGTGTGAGGGDGTGASAGGGGGDGTGAATGVDGEGSGGTAVDDDADGSGCACRATAPADGGWAWWLVLVGLVRRRRGS